MKKIVKGVKDRNRKINGMNESYARYARCRGIETMERENPKIIMVDK